MDKIVPTRKKVYIICCFKEYEYVWTHLNELINVKKEELIVPYCFMHYEQIDKALLSTTEELSQELNASREEIETAVFEQFLHEKNNHFKTYVTDAEEIVILLPEHASCKPEDISEKNQEIEFCMKLKNKRIRSTNLLEKEKQKVIKP